MRTFLGQAHEKRTHNYECFAKIKREETLIPGRYCRWQNIVAKRCTCLTPRWLLLIIAILS